MKQLDLKIVADEMLSEMSGITRASENTLEAYSRDIKEFVNFCSEKEINSIDRVSERTIRHFIIRLNENESTKSTISRKLSSLRRLFLFAIKNGYIEKNPIRRVSNPRIRRKIPEIINVDSYLEIFSLVDKNNVDKKIEVKEAKQIKAIFELLYGCALRVSELCSLDAGDVDFHGMSIRVLGKGSKVRVVPLGSKSAEVLKDYLGTLSAKSHSVPLFVDENGERITRHYIYRLVKSYLKDITDIKKKSPHILRHSAATHMLDNEADIMAVKEILGHENLSTTQIYTHVSVERLKKSYKKAHPKS